MGLIALASLVPVVLCALVYSWPGLSFAHRGRMISFEPTEPMSREQLFQSMLSANFALLLHDDFNQLGSSLPDEQAREILAIHWGVGSMPTYRVELETQLRRLGDSQIRRALPTARPRTNVEHPEFVTPGVPAGHFDLLTHDQISVLAWDIQQLAYLVRLGYKVDYLPRDYAQAILQDIAALARSHFSSWSDYSLSALVGMRLRGPMEIFGVSEWNRFSQTHALLLTGRAGSPLAEAAAWRDVSSISDVLGGPFGAVPAPGLNV
jgi:hypothetical protein